MHSRYYKQLLIPEISKTGQESLSQSSVVVIGAGGLGSPVLYYLAASGVGSICIVDPDNVELTNLNRQFIHFEKDLGQDKAQSAKEKLSAFNSEIAITTSCASVTAQNAADIIAGHTLVLSCVDNYKTRVVLNHACIQSSIPLIDGGVNGLTGYVLVVQPGISPCYQCVFPQPPALHTESSVLGAAAGTVGSIMAAQAIKYLAGIMQGFAFLLIDLQSLTFQSIQTKICPNCSACQTLLL